MAKAKKAMGIGVAPEPTMADQKILWARAAGRCSWCKVKLTLDRDKEPAVTLGEMCHIVGEKILAARGRDALEMADRGKYSNLILLCRHHHAAIDRYEAKYSISVLHEMKDQHERWVEDKLAQTPDPDDLVYADVIDTVTKTLPFNRWRTFTDNAVRDMIHPDLIEARGILNDMILKTIWPKKHPELQKAVRAMVQAFNDFISLYEANADQPVNSHLLRPLRGYRRGPIEHVLRGQSAENEWSNACYALLWDFVVNLNTYSEAVRTYLNPMYRRREGRFLIYDDSGTRHGMEPMIVDPDPNQSRKLIDQYVPAVRKRLLEGGK